MAATVAGAAAVPAGAIASPPALARVAETTNARAVETTIDEKYRAAAVLGWVPREEVTLSDRDFVSVLWEKASEKHNAEVKAAALAAFSDATDADAASAEFIRTGIFAANNRDAAAKARKAELDTIRLRAAQEINWVPANNTERTTMLDQTLQNYLLAFWRKAATWPEVKAAAEPLTAADATDEQRLDFLQHALFEKAEADRQNEIANGNAEEVAARQAAALRSAKEKAVATALKRSATSYELDDLEMRELIYLFASQSTGRKVKLDATVAYANSSEEVWVAFIFTGVHLANKVDLDERDLAEARANEVRVRDIMYAAEADGFQPETVTAAKRALEGPALDRSLFLLGGHDTARQADYVRPSANKTVMIQAAGYNGCIAEPITWVADYFLAGVELNARVEPCNEGNVSQRWTLVPDTTTGRYKLLNEHESACLFPPPSKISQDGAPITAFPCANAPATTAATIWELLDGGQGNVEIRNVTNNKVITAVAGSSAGSLNIVQNPNGHLAAQQWRLIDPSHQAAASRSPAGSFRIKGVQSGRCVRPIGALGTAGSGALANGADMELRDCGSGTEQIWDVTRLSDTRFEVRNRASGYCIYGSAGWADVVNGGSVEQVNCGSHYTSWSVMFQKSAGSYLRHTISGAYLGARDNGTANGTLVKATDYSAATDQQWILEPVSEGATAPAPIWASSGKPLTSFSGTAVTFQPACTSTDWAISFWNPTTSAHWRSDAANAKKGLIRADVTAPPTTQTPFQYCVVGMPTSTQMEVTLRNIGRNAYVREAMDVSPAGMLIADQTSAANAERFILQQRRSTQISGNMTILVLQSKATKKYAQIDTTATGTNSKVVRFINATPGPANELQSYDW
ncbi:RICIN domain-containing protein [Plantactinospora sp. S1510]|uniref:RICIN domain-containing protein n=1 Tax=Plantactinospora alkalitolerans TaxID=2789879 RepID=A0ABS0H256_9ACTN|nr:RICIN domain-containing protein [Plantactinospora alkalitolerans]MBF9132520.1 RICIN domain-containing protein [Plantactinospora alkalitolerans]